MTHFSRKHVAFRNEAKDYLRSWERICLDFQDGKYSEKLEFLRILHTFKGSAGAVGLREISDLAHALEGMLESQWKTTPRLDKKQLDALFHSQEKLSEYFTQWSDASSIPKENFQDNLNEIRLATVQFSLPSTNHSDGDIQVDEDALDEFLARTAAPLNIVEENIEPEGHFEDEEFIKVSLKKIEAIIKTVQNMTVFQNVIFEAIKNGTTESIFAQDAIEINKKSLVYLQNSSVSLRMTSLMDTFQSAKRTAYDVARRTHKDIEVKITGARAEVDRTVLSSLSDALGHIIRNCVDHGIESRDLREKHGKGRVGVIKLSAHKKPNCLEIRISDDGNGINVPKVRAKAIEMGILKDSASVSEEEIAKLIFHPGFSTADKVTDISGRGVGMDVAKSNMEKFGAKIKIQTTMGQGTSFAIAIPMNVNLMDVFIIQCKEIRFAIPVQIVRAVFERDECPTLDVGESGKAIHFKGNIVPLLGENQVLSVIHPQHRIQHVASLPSQAKDADTIEFAKLEKVILVVISNDEKLVGLEVTKLIGQQRIHSRPLNEVIDTFAGLTGMTIFSDGSPGLVVDLGKVFESQAVKCGGAA